MQVCLNAAVIHWPGSFTRPQTSAVAGFFCQPILPFGEPACSTNDMTIPIVMDITAQPSRYQDTYGALYQHKTTPAKPQDIIKGVLLHSIPPIFV